MKFNLRLLIIPFAVILAVALGGGVYWILESQGIIKYPEFISNLLPWENPTRDWKTFTSEEFDFSVKYSPDWTLITEKEDVTTGFFFIGPDQDLSDKEIAGKKATGYSAISIYRPLFAILPVGEFDHGLPDSDQIESKQLVSMKGRPFNITRYTDGYIVVAEKYDPNVKPGERSPFRIEFYPGSKNLLSTGFFGVMFGTLEFFE